MSAQQQRNGDAFEHACALKLIAYYNALHQKELYIVTCATFERQKKVFDALSEKERARFLKQAGAFIDRLFNMESFFLKGYHLPVSLCMLGAAHGKKGNTTDIEVHFVDGARLNISCKHRSEENKAPRICFDPIAQCLSITSFDFCHQDPSFTQMMDSQLKWLKEKEGLRFSKDRKSALYAQKWMQYEDFCMQFADTCNRYLSASSVGLHTQEQKNYLKEIVEFFIGTHSYFLLKKVNEYDGVIQKVDAQRFCQMLQQDAVHLKSVKSFGIANAVKNPKGQHNNVIFEFSNGFCIKMRIKNGCKIISPTSLKFSVNLINSDTLFATEALLFSEITPEVD